MAGYSHKSWCCPYFKWDNKEAIKCEGGTLKFPDFKTCSQFADQYCASLMGNGWKLCTIARTISLWYVSQPEYNDEEKELRPYEQTAQR